MANIKLGNDVLTGVTKIKIPSADDTSQLIEFSEGGGGTTFTLAFSAGGEPAWAQYGPYEGFALKPDNTVVTIDGTASFPLELPEGTVIISESINGNIWIQAEDWSPLTCETFRESPSSNNILQVVVVHENLIIC